VTELNQCGLLRTVRYASYGGGHDAGSEASSIYSHRKESDNPAKRMD